MSAAAESQRNRENRFINHGSHPYRRSGNVQRLFPRPLSERLLILATDLMLNKPPTFLLRSFLPISEVAGLSGGDITAPQVELAEFFLQRHFSSSAINKYLYFGILW